VRDLNLPNDDNRPQEAELAHVPDQPAPQQGGCQANQDNNAQPEWQERVPRPEADRGPLGRGAEGNTIVRLITADRPTNLTVEVSRANSSDEVSGSLDQGSRNGNVNPTSNENVPEERGGDGCGVVLLPESWLVTYSSYGLFEVVGDFIVKYGKTVDFPAVLMGDSNIEVGVTSSDVIHSWTVNGLAVKADAVPGRLNTVHLRNLRPGFTSWGGCSEMCGVNHWQIRVEVEVLRPKDYCLWIFTVIYHDIKETILNS